MPRILLCTWMKATVFVPFPHPHARHFPLPGDRLCGVYCAGLCDEPGRRDATAGLQRPGKETPQKGSTKTGDAGKAQEPFNLQLLPRVNL